MKSCVVYAYADVNDDADVDEDEFVYANVDVYESSIVCTAGLSSPDFAWKEGGAFLRLTRGRPSGVRPASW